MAGECFCVRCSHLDWIDSGVYGDKAWCKIEATEHREPRDVIDGSFCKDYTESRRQPKL